MPYPDRTVEEWKKEIVRDMNAVGHSLRFMDEDDALKSVAYMLKEARRLESDLYRMGAVMGLTKEQIDAYGPL